MLNLIKFAKKARHPYFKHATIILAGSRMQAWGVNHDHVHSERNAASKIKGSLAGYTIINIRITKTGKLANSKPCPNCEAYLRNRNASGITYTIPEGFVEETYGR